MDRANNEQYFSERMFSIKKAWIEHLFHQQGSGKPLGLKQMTTHA